MAQAPGPYGLVSSLSPATALMFLTDTFDAILELAPIVRELFGHFVGSPGHIAAYDGPEANDLTDVESV